VSQTELARSMGFNPTHGYKYVLRLEKGLVPNPTLRTLAAFLRACGAGWQSIVDVLPTLGLDETEAAPVAPEREATVAEPVPPRSVHTPPQESRPMREVLRRQRQEERAVRTRDFWSRVGRAEELTLPLLHGPRLTSAARRALVAFLRACCAIINNAAGRRADPAPEIEKLMQSAQTSGLDLRLLHQIRDTCISVFKDSGTA